MSRSPGRPRRRVRVHATVRWVRSGGISTLILLLPLLLTFGYFAWFPIGNAVVMSFQETNLVDEPTWIGLDNFTTIFGDPLFWTSVRNTVYFTFLALLFGYPVPLVLAVLMSEFRRGLGLYSMLAYLPVVVPPVVAVLLWRFFYDASTTGVFNTILGWVGLGPFEWIQSASMAMPSLVLQATWANAGATVIIYLAALTSVRAELYDAVEVDGAGIWYKIWHVTLPQLRHILLITLILQVIATFQIFTEPFLMTGGGPNNATTTILLQIYNYAFRFGDYGAATALSLVLAVFLAIMSAIYFRATRSWSTS
ncbi:ABC transporter permease subunit [Phytoactinopolyspora halophila]|uniref:ABC transporter permease subunit n=1 Tax=Phytoactinopolyspora halophila TaxID=1981511 RepID=UPI0014782844